MKKLFFLATLFFISAKAFAGSSYFYSCDTKELCYWNTEDSKFDVDCAKEDYSCRFKMNNDKTIIEHITPTIKSAYYVDKYEYDSKNDVDVYDVTSDVGNKYTFIFDMKNNEIRILNSSDVNNMYLISYSVKKNWTE